MDKIWYRNPSTSEVIGRCGGDEKNGMTTQNRQKSNAKNIYKNLNTHLSSTCKPSGNFKTCNAFSCFLHTHGITSRTSRFFCNSHALNMLLDFKSLKSKSLKCNSKSLKQVSIRKQTIILL